MRTRASRRRLLLGLLLAAGPVWGCGDTTLPEPQGELAFLVGDWDAEAMVVASLSDPLKTADVLAQRGAFRLNVQPSGQYTATAIFSGVPATEMGVLRIRGTAVTFFREFPSPDTATGVVTQLSADRVRLVGESTYDFDDDLPGQREAVTLTTDLARRE